MEVLRVLDEEAGFGECIKEYAGNIAEEDVWNGCKPYQLPVGLVMYDRANRGQRNKKTLDRVMEAETRLPQRIWRKAGAFERVEILVGRV